MNENARCTEPQAGATPAARRTHRPTTGRRSWPNTTPRRGSWPGHLGTRFRTSTKWAASNNNSERTRGNGFSLARWRGRRPDDRPHEHAQRDRAPRPAWAGPSAPGSCSPWCCHVPSWSRSSPASSSGSGTSATTASRRRGGSKVDASLSDELKARSRVETAAGDVRREREHLPVGRHRRLPLRLQGLLTPDFAKSNQLFVDSIVKTMKTTKLKSDGTGAPHRRCAERRLLRDRPGDR